jgi:tetratricopeptide (TPR) repeat protein
MAEKKNVPEADHNDQVIAKAKDFWDNYQKPVMVACAIIIVLGGGWLGYNKYFKTPNEEKAADAIFKAEEYYRMDSLQRALKGDGINFGFIKVIDKYGGTVAGNLARFYAGDCYLRTGDYANAVKQLKSFSTDAKQVQARAYKLLADAYSEQGKNEDAISSYRKAANHFKEDDANASTYLFYAAALSEKAGKTKEAVELYKELKEKYPQTEQGFNAEKQLAKLGVYE